MSKGSPELPADVLYHILEQVPAKEISNCTLVCRAFATVGRKKRFERVTIRNLKQGQSLAHLVVAQNGTLLSSTTHFTVGVKTGSEYPYIGIWDWLGLADGARLVRSLTSVRHLTLCSMQCKTLKAAGNHQTTAKTLRLLAQSSPAICSVTLANVRFMTAPMAVAIMDIFGSAVSYDLEYRLPLLKDRFPHIITIPIRVSNPVQTLTLRNAHKTDHTDVLGCMLEASRLDHLQHLTIWLVDPKGLEHMVDVLHRLSPTLVSLTLDHIQQFNHADFLHPAPREFILTPMKKLTTLRVRWFDPAIAIWLAQVLTPIISRVVPLDELALWPAFMTSQSFIYSPTRHNFAEWDDLALHVRNIGLVVYLTDACSWTEALMNLSSDEIARAILPMAHAHARIHHCEVRRSKIPKDRPPPGAHMSRSYVCNQLERYDGEDLEDGQVPTEMMMSISKKEEPKGRWWQKMFS